MIERINIKCNCDTIKANFKKNSNSSYKDTLMLMLGHNLKFYKLLFL